MPNFLPKNRPQMSRKEAESIIAYHRAMFPEKFDGNDQIVVLGIRGYFLDSLGKKNANDYNVYDDAIIVVAPNYYKTFNANCDPSFVKDPKDQRPLAKLNLGVYRFYKGKHQNKYPAFRAYPEGVVLPCTRAGAAATCSYINIHYGGEAASWYLTWSHGCQTIPKSQFVNEFQPEIYSLMNKFNQKTIVYILVEAKQNGDKRAYLSGNNSFVQNPEKIEKVSADVRSSRETSGVSQKTEQPPNFEQPSSETKVEVKDGKVSVETSENKTPPKKIAIEKTEKKGFISTIRTEISALVAGNGGLQALIDYAQQVAAFGLSPRFWQIVGFLAIAGSIIYLIYRFLDFRADANRDLELTNKLIEANSTADNQVYLVDKEHINALDDKEFEVIRR